MIKLIKSSFFNESKTKEELVNFILSADQFSFGKECLKFEKKFSKFQDRKQSVFVNSGSSANLAIIQALLNLGRIKVGDKVAFSALTWSTNVMPIIQLGLVPVPIDVELSTLNMSSNTLRAVLVKQDIKLVFITNLLGFCDDIDEISALCKNSNCILIEDNCESMGSRYKGKLLGNFGLASTFSFYVGHHMSTIEGGMVCTDDDELATMLRIVRAHGWDRNLPRVEQRGIRSKFQVNSTFYSRYTFYDLGYNLRPNEITGFIGNKQLKYINQIINKRQRNFLQIAKVLYKQDKYFYPVDFSHMDTVSNFAVPIICKSVSIRDQLVKKCAKKVEIRPVVGGDMTQQPFFAKHVHLTSDMTKMTNASLIHKQGLYFGNNPEMTTDEISLILKLFTDL